MLVHICCAVDSHYFLQKLQKEFPDEKLIGFFYDPNIHPYSEYKLRLMDVRRSCKLLNIELIEGEYDTGAWLQAVRGLEKEPEKGKRCTVCFDRRFEVSAQKASRLGETHFTSTLLVSPKKSLKQLKTAGDSIAEKYQVKFIAPDYRKASGTQEQNIIAKKSQLYRQDYCGCLFGLGIQREQQERLADELFSPISRQVQPESIEYRIALYRKRVELEESNMPYRIVKERFLNWRLLSGRVEIQGDIVPSHFLPYSTLKKEYSRGKIEYSIGNLHYMNRDEIKFIELSYYSQLADKEYASVTELTMKPPKFDRELEIRKEIISSPYDLSTIIVVEEIPQSKIKIYLQSRIYSDVKDRLMLISETNSNDQ